MPKDSKNVENELKEQCKHQKEQLHILQQKLDVALQAQSAAEIEGEDAKSSNRKLAKKLTEIQDNLSRETDLRSSLETSHNALLSRISDLEAVVQKERQEVTKLNQNYVTIKHECLEAQQAAHLQTQLHEKLTEELFLRKADSEKCHVKITELQSEKQLLLQKIEIMKQKNRVGKEKIEELSSLQQQNQMEYLDLQQKTKSLQDAMQAAAQHNARLVSQYEQRIEADRMQLANKTQSDKQILSLQEQLVTDAHDKAKLQAKCESLEVQWESSQKAMIQNAEIEQEKFTKLEETIKQLKAELQSVENERQRALKDNSNLKQKIDLTLEEVSQERVKRQAEVKEVHLEKKCVEEAKAQLLNENSMLQQRVCILKEYQDAQKPVEASFADMMEQKNKLAFEKGRLQTTVEQLQEQVQKMPLLQAELSQARKFAAGLQRKFQQSQSELNTALISVQQLDGEVKQLTASTERKDRDFVLAIQSRDSTLKEFESLKETLQVDKQNDKLKISRLQQNLQEAKEDNKKIACTLEGVVTSHSQLQSLVETLQVELGSKQSLAEHLQETATKLQGRNSNMHQELDLVNNKLTSLQDIDTVEVGKLAKALQKSIIDNRNLSSTLDMMKKVNYELQLSGESLQDDLTKKTNLIEQLQKTREKEQNEPINASCDLYKNQKHLIDNQSKSLKQKSKAEVELRKRLEEVKKKKVPTATLR